MTTSHDPYGYGPPPPVSYGSKVTGRAILDESWMLLKRDRQMIVLPLLGSVFGLVAGGILFVPGWILGREFGHGHGVAGTTGLVLASYAATVVGLYFQAAVVIAANERSDGRTPTLSGVLAAAWSIRGRILAWALVSTTIGFALRAIEERLGFFGKLLGFVGGLAWAVASFFERQPRGRHPAGRRRLRRDAGGQHGAQRDLHLCPDADLPVRGRTRRTRRSSRHARRGVHREAPPPLTATGG